MITRYLLDAIGAKVCTCRQCQLIYIVFDIVIIGLLLGIAAMIGGLR